MKLVDKLKDLLGACPMCHKFSGTEIDHETSYEKPFRIEVKSIHGNAITQVIESTEEITLIREFCRNCRYVIKEEETTDITSEVRPGEMAKIGDYEDFEEIYYKNGEEIGRINFEPFYHDNR